MRAPPQSSYSQHDIDLGINSSAEVSFWLAPETWGLGYASASLGFLSTIAFELFEQDSVWAKCFSWNERCIRTLIRYGFMMQTAVAIDDKKNGEPAKLFFVLSSTPNINETGTW